MKPILLTLAAIPVIFFAATGFACLYMTAPLVSNSEECDVIQAQNGREWCMNLIHEPKAEPLPIPNVPKEDTALELKSAEKINPQSTVQAEELQ